MYLRDTYTQCIIPTMMKEKNIECRVLLKLQHHGGQSHYSFFVYVYSVQARSSDGRIGTALWNLTLHT